MVTSGAQITLVKTIIFHFISREWVHCPYNLMKEFISYNGISARRSFACMSWSCNTKELQLCWGMSRSFSYELPDCGAVRLVENSLQRNTGFWWIIAEGGVLQSCYCSAESLRVKDPILLVVISTAVSCPCSPLCPLMVTHSQLYDIELLVELMIWALCP